MLSIVHNHICHLIFIYFSYVVKILPKFLICDSYSLQRQRRRDELGLLLTAALMKKEKFHVFSVVKQQ
jgi:hypothetical protein